MDCVELTPNARKIFGEITAYYQPDPWKNPRCTDNGRVSDNGWHDLRNKADRDKLIRFYEHLIGSTVVSSARNARDKHLELTDSVLNLQMSKRWIELAILLHELDFQIETLDQVE